MHNNIFMLNNHIYIKFLILLEITIFQLYFIHIIMLLYAKTLSSVSLWYSPYDLVFRNSRLTGQEALGSRFPELAAEVFSSLWLGHWET